MNARIPLTRQEIEFALACRDFLGERDLSACERIRIDQCELVIPADAELRRNFLDFGVARLMRTFQLAIDNRAMPLDQATSIVTKLAAFNEKIVSALVPRSDRSKH